MWHAQITSLTLRQLSGAEAYARHESPTAIAQVELLGDHSAHIHAAARLDGKPLTRADWREIGLLLRDQFGLTEATADRHGRRVVMTAARWLPAKHPHVDEPPAF